MAPVGVALIFGIVIIGTVGIVVLGGAAIDRTQDQAEVQRAEHVLTLFDSRTAMVALGDSTTQTTELVGSGPYRTNSTAGHITLVHSNYNDSDDEVLYSESMGTLFYNTGKTEVAYQGGGVWRKSQSGDAQMVSPPEFHFRQSTLTVPLIRLTNNASGSGPTDARVSSTGPGTPVYPNPSTIYADGSNRYSNPLENGTLVVYVRSQYYEGWAQYFRTRTEANVTEFPDNQTVKADLVSVGNRGNFPMPEEGNSLPVRGLSDDDHTLSEFRINITDSDTEADLNNLQWAMYVSSGSEQLELGLSKDGGGDPCGEDVRVSLYYTPDAGTTQHTWQNDSAFTIQCSDVDGDGEQDAFVEVDFTSPTVNLSYKSDGDFKSKGLVQYRNDHQTGNVPDTITWDEHGSVGYEQSGRTISNDDEMPINDIVNHYFALTDEGQGFQLTVADQQGGNQGSSDGSVSEAVSSGYINYPGSGQYIAYLHVTQNDVEIEFQ